MTMGIDVTVYAPGAFVVTHRSVDPASLARIEAQAKERGWKVTVSDHAAVARGNGRFR